MIYAHLLFVVLFLMIYLVKAGMLMGNKVESFEKFSSRIKIPEMVISLFFLLTGFYLLYKSDWHLPGWMHPKLTLVVVSIPLAILGTRKKNKWMLLSSVVCLLVAFGLASKNGGFIVDTLKGELVVTDHTSSDYDEIIHGQKIYTKFCVSCHGEDGNKGINGATDLSKSYITLNEKFGIIKFGREEMTSFNSKLNDYEIKAVSSYIEKLVK